MKITESGETEKEIFEKNEQTQRDLLDTIK